LRKEDQTESTQPGKKEILSIPKAMTDYITDVCGVVQQVASVVQKGFFHFLEIASFKCFLISQNVMKTNKVKKILSHPDYRKSIIGYFVSNARSQKDFQETQKKIVKNSNMTHSEKDLYFWSSNDSQEV